MVVDQDIAFVGGLDLCFGRWDTVHHVLTDASHLCTHWPGKDYSNEGYKITTDVDQAFVGKKRGKKKCNVS